MITAQNEAFVEFYEGIAARNGAKAYRLAYPDSKSGHNAAAARLLAKDSIKEAVLAKREQNRQLNEYNRQQAHINYQTILALAIKKGDLASANTAIKGINRLYALESDKIEVEAYQGRVPQEGAIERSRRRIESTTRPQEAAGEHNSKDMTQTTSKSNTGESSANTGQKAGAGATHTQGGGGGGSGD